MTKEQEEHLKYIKEAFVREVDAKYRAGAIEHGGNLFDMGSVKLCENGMQEAIDQYVYLFTLKQKLIGEAIAKCENSSSR